MNFNPSATDKVVRNIDRIKTLKIAIGDTYDPERLESLNKELTRRKGELQAIKDSMNEALS
jgi:flagellin-like hook-associated protein FlgL